MKGVQDSGFREIKESVTREYLARNDIENKALTAKERRSNT